MVSKLRRPRAVLSAAGLLCCVLVSSAWAAAGGTEQAPAGHPPDGSPAVSLATGKPDPTGDGSAAEAREGDRAGGFGDAGAAVADRSATAEAPHPSPSRLFADGLAGPVLIIDVSGEITPASASFVERAIAESPDAGLVVFRIDTFGGRIDAAVRIRDAALELSVPSIAFVPHRAISAGALIALASQTVVFGPAASMGAATPVQIDGGEAAPVGEKVVSYMRAEMRSTAEARGRRADVAEAMVDASVEIEGVVDGETLLTVTTREALELGVADAVSDSLPELLAAVGAGDAPRVEPRRNWAERVSGFLTSPIVAGILMSLGLLGLAVELYHPGVGLPGAVGALCLAAFFFGHMVVALAGWEELALLLAGFGLLAVELFVLPGFGITGVAGIVSIVAALLMAMLGDEIGVSMDAGVFDAAARRLFFSLVGVIVLAIALARFIPARAYPNWLVLRTTIADASGAKAPAETTVAAQVVVGDVGESVTDLRPSGKARVRGAVVDVVSRLDWIDRGSPVIVTEVGGVRVVVEPTGPETPPRSEGERT